MTSTMSEIASTTAKIRAIADARRRADHALSRLDADLITDALIVALHRRSFANRTREDADYSQTTGGAYAVLAALDATGQEIAVAALAQMIHERTAPRLGDPYNAPKPSSYPTPILSAEEAAEQAARRGIAHAGDMDD